MPIASGSVHGIDDRIVGGTKVNIEDHPYVISVRHGKKNDHICGGALFTETRALTAARCVWSASNNPDHQYSIMAGSAEIPENMIENTRTLTKILWHPGFGKPKDKVPVKDIAILFWRRPLTLGPKIQPIALPRDGYSPDLYQKCNITGFGKLHENDTVRADRLMNAVVPIVDLVECSNSYNGSVDLGMVCAGWFAGGWGICNGDIGSPLVSNGFLLGVASWSDGCARPRIADVFTRVSWYVDWIRKNI